MKLKDTYNLMISENWQDRLKAEYYQVKIRIEKLETFLAALENNEIDKPECSNYTLLYQTMCYQLSHMKDYKKCLQSRMDIQGVEY